MSWTPLEFLECLWDVLFQFFTDFALLFGWIGEGLGGFLGTKITSCSLFVFYSRFARSGRGGMRGAFEYGLNKIELRSC